MVEWSVLTLSGFFEIALFTGLFLSLLIKLNNKGAAVRGGVSLFFTVIVAFVLNAGIIFDAGSKFFEGVISSLSVVSLLLLLLVLFLIKKRANKFNRIKLGPVKSWTLSLLLVLILLPRLIEFSKVIEQLVFQSNMFNTGILWDVLGVFLGLFLSIALLFAVVKNSKRAASSALLIYFFIFAVPGIISYMTTSLQAFVLEGVLPMNQSFLSIFLIPLINSQTMIKYITLALGLLFIPIVVFGKNRYLIPLKTVTPAKQRKHKTHLKREIRWIAVFTTILLAVYSLQGVAALQKREKNVEVASATAVSAKGGKITIPLRHISGNELKRFSYQGKENKVTFLVIAKGSGVYGVALDACQICGPAGFYQEKDNVICIKCQSVVNKSTVGFPGGCNPIPLEHKIKNGNLIIDEKVLLENEKIFKK